jgi:hypothetical protein
MFPAVNVTPVPQLNNATPPNPSATRESKPLSPTVAKSNWKTQSPVTSPDLKTTSKLQIAQSELPGSNSAPPTPSIRDTGNGYPSRIPQNYFGPAIGFGNNSSYFGIISRFPFSENYSIRPSAVFGSNGTILRVPVTYDFMLGEKEPFERNPVVTFHAGGGVQFSSGGGTVQGDKFSLLGTAGVDVNLFEGIALVADYNTNFGNVSGANIGLGFEF